MGKPSEGYTGRYPQRRKGRTVMKKDKNDVGEEKGIKNFKKEGDVNNRRIKKYPMVLAFGDSGEKLRVVMAEVKLHLVEELQHTKQRRDEGGGGTVKKSFYLG